MHALFLSNPALPVKGSFVLRKSPPLFLCPPPRAPLALEPILFLGTRFHLIPSFPTTPCSHRLSALIDRARIRSLLPFFHPMDFMSVNNLTAYTTFLTPIQLHGLPLPSSRSFDFMCDCYPPCLRCLHLTHRTSWTLPTSSHPSDLIVRLPSLHLSDFMSGWHLYIYWTEWAPIILPLFVFFP